jgi:hypothetical protein
VVHTVKTTLLNVTVLALFLGCTASVRAGLIDYVVSASGQFGTINLQTGAFTSIGTTNFSPDGFTGLPGGILYGNDYGSNLLAVNPATGQGTLVGNMGHGILAVYLRSDGTMFGAAFDGSWYTINRSTGAATLVGATGLGLNYWGGAFDSSGDMFLANGNGANSSNLYSVNASTGHATLIGSIGYAVAQLDFEQGTLFGFTADGTSIISVNTTTGAGTFVAAQDPALNTVFGAATTDSLATPEPASFISLAIGAVVGLAWRKRRTYRVSCAA